MKTILQSGLTQKTISSSELDPLVAVSDNQLLVNTRPSRFGVFRKTGSGELPSITAKQFRITNAGATPVVVTQKTPLLIRTFDSTIDVNVDSDTIRLESVDSYTPNGDSGVLEITHAGDSAAYDTVETIESFFGVQAYFKVNSIGWTNATQPNYAVKPFGIYTSKEAIDTKLPALAVGVGLDATESPAFRIFTANTVDESLPAAILGRWYRVNIEAAASNFEFVVNLYIESPEFSGEWTQVFSTTVTSTGTGMLDEIFGKNSFVIGMGSDGSATQNIESLFVYRDVNGEEELLPSSTKEYYCVNNLDEYRVSGDVTGYFTS